MILLLSKLNFRICRFVFVNTIQSYKVTLQLNKGDRETATGVERAAAISVCVFQPYPRPCLNRHNLKLKKPRRHDRGVYTVCSNDIITNIRQVTWDKVFRGAWENSILMLKHE